MKVYNMSRDDNWGVAPQPSNVEQNIANSLTDPLLRAAENIRKEADRMNKPYPTNNHASSGSAPAMSFAEPSEFIRLNERISKTTDIVSELRARVSGIADHLYGPTPPPPQAAPGSDGPEPSGQVERLNMTIDQLYTRLSELEGQIERLTML